jgi:SPP1 family predicted phage head-tail adaptor
MRQIDEIKLRTVTITADTGGFPAQAVTTKTVYADIKDVRQSEFYQAAAIGKRVDIVFVINDDEWNGETEIEYGGSVYAVTRKQPWRGRTELTCTRM